MTSQLSPRRRRAGFTLVELIVVVIVLGLLAAMGVPSFLKSVERSKASEAFTYLSAVRAAQERFHARQGTYTDQLGDLDLRMQAPRYFIVGTISTGTTGHLRDSWKLTLARTGPSSGYGAYTVTFSEDGYWATESTVENHPSINPMVPR